MEERKVFDCRFLIWKRKKYLLNHDVAQIIREIAGTEKTDVRNRLNELANNFEK
jgi:hypothetical protein